MEISCFFLYSPLSYTNLLVFLRLTQHVASLAEANDNAVRFGLDGVMLGRASFGNPWLFSPSPPSTSLEPRLACMIEHTLLWEKLLGRKKSFDFLKKHFRRSFSFFFFLFSFIPCFLMSFKQVFDLGEY